MTQGMRAFLDGEIVYALTSPRDTPASRLTAKGYKQDPETVETKDVTLTGRTLTGRTLTRVRDQGRECELWETPAWCDPEIHQ